MSYKFSILVLMAVLVSGPLFPAAAEEALLAAPEEKGSSVELEEVEIKGILKDIVGAFQLKQMEIVGGLDAPPNVSIEKDWKPPVPFPDQPKDLAQPLIDRSYLPLDHDSFSKQVIMITGSLHVNGTKGITSNQTEIDFLKSSLFLSTR